MSDDNLKKERQMIWNDWKWLVKLHLIGFPISFFVIITGLHQVLPIWIVHILLFPSYICIISWPFLPFFAILYLFMNMDKF